MLVIVLEYQSHFPQWHVNTAEAENLDGRSTSSPLILSP